MKVFKKRMVAALAVSVLLLCWMRGAAAHAADVLEMQAGSEIVEEQICEQNGEFDQENVADDATAQATLGPVATVGPEDTPAPEATKPVNQPAGEVAEVGEDIELPTDTETPMIEDALVSSATPESTEEPPTGEAATAESAPEAEMVATEMLSLIPTVTSEATPTDDVSVSEESAPVETPVPQVAETPAATETFESVETPENTLVSENVENTVIPEMGENTGDFASPEATEAPQETVPESTEPIETAPTPAPVDTEAPFTSGYAGAPAGLEVYVSRQRKEEYLLLTTDETGYVYVLELYGEANSWARICLAYKVEGETAAMEGYVRFDWLRPVTGEEQPSVAAKLEKGGFICYNGVVLQTLAATLPESVDSEPVVTVAPEVYDEIAESQATETSTIAAPEVPALQESLAVKCSVNIVVHAGEIIREGDIITLEAVAEGFDHEPVFTWEYQMPGDERWYSCETADGSFCTFVVDQYNSYFNWRVSAE